MRYAILAMLVLLVGCDSPVSPSGETREIAGKLTAPDPPWPAPAVRWRYYFLAGPRPYDLCRVTPEDFDRYEAEDSYFCDWKPWDRSVHEIHFEGFD